MSEYIGIVIDKNEKTLIMVIDPDDDHELDESCWITSDIEERELIKIRRSSFSLFDKGTMNMYSVAYIHENLQEFIGI